MATRTNDLRQFNGMTFKVNKIYNDYRDGWTDDGVTKIHRTFKWFGKADDQVLTSGTERIKTFTKEYENSAWRELREQIWNQDGVAEFHKVKDKMDNEFYKTWKKVFDLEIEFAQPVDLKVWKRLEGHVVVSDNIINLTTLSAGKLKNMIRGVLDEPIPMTNGKDKVGNPSVVEVYDFEDGMKHLLEGKFVKVKVSGSGLDTTYMFQPWKEFVSYNGSDEVDVNDLPF